MKTCTKCEIEKDESEFNKDKSRKDGLASQCRECKKKYQNKYYQQNKEETKIKRGKYHKEYYEQNKEEIQTQDKNRYERNKIRNKEKFLLRNARERAKKKGIEFNLKLDDIVIPDICPILRHTDI